MTRALRHVVDGAVLLEWPGRTDREANAEAVAIAAALAAQPPHGFFDAVPALPMSTSSGIAETWSFGRRVAALRKSRAFRASFSHGEPGPTIAILAEYDALPGIGHACGHNVIATAGVGAGAALAALRDRLPKGRVQVIGTPAEEGGGGKVKLINGGVFKTVDAAMMIHGFDRWIMHQDLLGIVRVGFEFTGKAAHASADPWEGVNALDAVIQTFNNVSMLRQQIRPESRIHGIVTSGGAAANIIPEFAAATFYVRAAALDYMWALQKRVIACAEGAAKATGTTLKVIQNPDNVSQVIPAIQPMVQIAPEGTPIHSRAFEQAAVTPLARDGMLTSAKIMAMTTCDLLANPALVKDARREFEATK